MARPMNPAFSIALNTDSLESFLEKRKSVASPAKADTPKALVNTDKDIKFSSLIGVTAVVGFIYVMWCVP
ncbi:MAG: hypothetical protein EBZ69_01050 [Alphaproteobacteria bacterium]|nr:hypothetical protein [Alphaproteobacteria bacterium]